MPATVVDDVTEAIGLFSDESIGPIVAIIRTRDTDHEVKLANDNQYGLAAAVLTCDIVKVLSVARRINSGICNINGWVVHYEPQMPFGGVEASGHGRFGGKQGIDSFSEARLITTETQPGQFPI